MLTIKEFLKQSEIKKVSKDNPEKLLTLDFYRDPLRVIYVDNMCFYSPADGFILYAKTVRPNEDIIEIKGGEYTVNSLMQEEIKEKCIVIGIFMTALDVHINRMPTKGFLKHEKLPALKTSNLSMRAAEKDILEKLKFKPEDMQYAVYNERVKNRVFCPIFNQHYWMIQIADMEVDVIAHFGDSDEMYMQGDKFSVIRYGSQVDLIIPLLPKSKYKFTNLLENDIGKHIEAGIDEIIQIEKK